MRGFKFGVNFKWVVGVLIFSSLAGFAADEKPVEKKAAGPVVVKADAPAAVFTMEGWKIGEVTSSNPSFTPVLPTIHGDFVVYSQKYVPKSDGSTENCIGQNIYAQVLPGRTVAGASKGQFPVSAIPCVNDIISIGGQLWVDAYGDDIVVEKAGATLTGDAQANPVANVTKNAFVYPRVYVIDNLLKAKKPLEEFEALSYTAPDSVPVARLSVFEDMLKVSPKYFDVATKHAYRRQLSFVGDTLMSLTFVAGGGAYLDGFDAKTLKPKFKHPIAWKRADNELGAIVQFAALDEQTVALVLTGTKDRMGRISVVRGLKGDGSIREVATTFGVGARDAYPEPGWTELSAKEFGTRKPADLVAVPGGFVAREGSSGKSWEVPFTYFFSPLEAGGKAKRIVSISQLHGIVGVRKAPGGFLVATQSPESILFVGNPSKEVGDLNWKQAE